MAITSIPYEKITIYDHTFTCGNFDPAREFSVHFNVETMVRGTVLIKLCESLSENNCRAKGN